jgi:4-amino-4-deoxy-L-arabinose transferase-like glycosyltransferase
MVAAAGLLTSRMSVSVVIRRAVSRASPLVFLLAAYAITRLHNLTVLPVFIDEVAAIERSLQLWDPRHAVLALSKAMYETKVLHPALVSLFTLWLDDSLWAARFLSVFAGGVSLSFCYLIGRRLFNRRVAALAGSLYLVSPFALFHDRLAVTDSLAMACAAVALWGSFELVSTPSAGRHLILGATLGLGVLAKATNALFFLTPILVWSLLGGQLGWREFWRRIRLPYLLAFGLPGIVYLWGVHIASLPPLGVISQMSVLNGGFDLGVVLRERWPALVQASGWLWTYLTPPVAITGVLGLLAAAATRRANAFVLGAATLAFVVPLLLVSRIWFPRYLLPVLPPLLVLTAATIDRFVRAVAAGLSLGPTLGNAVAAAVFASITIPAFITDCRLLTSPAEARVPDVERTQYFAAWSSGYGADEAARFLRQEAAEASGGVVAVCPESLGAYVALKFLLRSDPRIHVLYQPMNDDVSWSWLQIWAAREPTFIVLEQPFVAGGKDRPDLGRLEKTAEHVHTFPRPGGSSSVVVYRLNR